MGFRGIILAYNWGNGERGEVEMGGQVFTTNIQVKILGNMASTTGFRPAAQLNNKE